LFAGISGSLQLSFDNLTSAISNFISSPTYVDLSKETNSDYVAIEYTTPAPTARESETKTGKQVVISASDDLGYTNVLSFASIPETYKIGEKKRIKIYWEEGKKFVKFDAYDTNDNGKIDYVEWVTPHLSSQTFSIIFITKAEILDSNRLSIEDVYNKVKTKDGILASVGDSQYLRIKFEKNLTSSRDITIYARCVSGNAQVKVYEKDGSSVIATFESIAQGEVKSTRFI